MNYLQELNSTILEAIVFCKENEELMGRLLPHLSSMFGKPIISLDESYEVFMTGLSNDGGLTDNWLLYQTLIMTSLGELAEITQACFEKLLTNIISSTTHVSGFTDVVEGLKDLTDASYFVFAATRVYGNTMSLRSILDVVGE